MHKYVDVNRPRQDCDITCLLQFLRARQVQIEQVAIAPFLLQSPEEKEKKINWGFIYMNYNAHRTYIGMHIPSTIISFTVVIHFEDVMHTFNNNFICCMFNDVTVYLFSEMISTVM